MRDLITEKSSHSQESLTSLNYDLVLEDDSQTDRDRDEYSHLDEFHSLPGSRF